MAASKVFIVTGASKGIGAAIVQYLLSQSHKVVLAARSQDLLEKVKAAHPEQVEYVAGDITSADITQKLSDLAVKSFGQIDAIILNHGILDAKQLEAASIEDVKRTYDINVFSCLAMAKAGLAELKKTKGCLLWLSSGASVKAYTAWGAYGSSKAAVNSLSAHFAVEHPDITSICIGPGRVDTDMQALIRADGKEYMKKEQYDDFVDVYEQGRLLKPEQPGTVIAKFAANPQNDLSGEYLSWDSPKLAAYRE